MDKMPGFHPLSLIPEVDDMDQGIAFSLLINDCTRPAYISGTVTRASSSKSYEEFSMFHVDVSFCSSVSREVIFSRNKIVSPM